MATPVQYLWSASAGSFIVPRNSVTTAKPFVPFDTTGGNITYGLYVLSEETEWASLLVAERKSLAKRRIKPSAVNRAIKELRYRR